MYQLKRIMNIVKDNSSINGLGKCKGILIAYKSGSRVCGLHCLSKMGVFKGQKNATVSWHTPNRVYTQ